jgi:hypothetical protein
MGNISDYNDLLFAALPPGSFSTVHTPSYNIHTPFIHIHTNKYTLNLHYLLDSIVTNFIQSFLKYHIYIFKLLKLL